MKNSKLILFVLMIIMILAYFPLINYLDKSQTNDEAIQMGSPSIEIDWNEKEQLMFLNYLKELPDDIEYPNLASYKSSEQFKKFISSIREKEEVFIKINKQKSIVFEVLRLYTLKHEKDPRYLDELASLYGAQLQTSLYVLRSAHKIMQKTLPDDITYSQKEEGLKMIEEASYSNIKIVLHLFQQESFVNNEILLTYFMEYTPALVVLFNGDTKALLKIKIYEVLPLIKNQKLRKFMQKITI